MKKIYFLVFLQVLCMSVMADEMAKIVLSRPFHQSAAVAAIMAGGKNSSMYKHYLELDGQFLGNILLPTMHYLEFKVRPGEHTIIGYAGTQGPEDVKAMGPSYSYSLMVEAGKIYRLSVDEIKMTIREIDEKQWGKELKAKYPVNYLATYTLQDEVIYDFNGRAVASTTRPEVVNQTQQQVIVQQVSSTAALQISAISIATPFAEVSASSVLAVYKNEFGKYEMPEKDETFPYVAVRVRLQGEPNLIRLAKQNLTLYLGQMFQTEQTVTSYDNMVLFLIPSGAKNIYLTCGDGCERQLIYSGRLQANKIYDGVVEVR